MNRGNSIVLFVKVANEVLVKSKARFYCVAFDFEKMSLVSVEVFTVGHDVLTQLSVKGIPSEFPELLYYGIKLKKNPISLGGY